jgi:hypothetical protein
MKCLCQQAVRHAQQQQQRQQQRPTVQLAWRVSQLLKLHLQQQQQQ